MLKQYPMKVLYVFAIIVLLGLGLLDPISQDITYHNFADNHTIYGVYNFWNVVSNVPFLLVGAYALWKLKSMIYEKQMHIGFVLLFLGVSLVAFGSAYYHLSPNNETLIWDRLPMTITFMALFSIIISEFISVKKGKVLLYPLLGMGIFSVIYWVVSDDLRLYVFVQFYPMLMIPFMLLVYKPFFTLSSGYWYLLLCYFLAKILEYYDHAIYEILGVISGHSLKHMVAALGLYILVNSFLKRKKHLK